MLPVKHAILMLLIVPRAQINTVSLKIPVCIHVITDTSQNYKIILKSVQNVMIYAKPVQEEKIYAILAVKIFLLKVVNLHAQVLNMNLQ